MSIPTEPRRGPRRCSPSTLGRQGGIPPPLTPVRASTTLQINRRNDGCNLACPITHVEAPGPAPPTDIMPARVVDRLIALLRSEPGDCRSPNLTGRRAGMNPSFRRLRDRSRPPRAAGSSTLQLTILLDQTTTDRAVFFFLARQNVMSAPACPAYTAANVLTAQRGVGGVDGTSRRLKAPQRNSGDGRRTVPGRLALFTTRPLAPLPASVTEGASRCITTARSSDELCGIPIFHQPCLAITNMPIRRFRDQPRPIEERPTRFTWPARKATNYMERLIGAARGGSWRSIALGAWRPAQQLKPPRDPDQGGHRASSYRQRRFSGVPTHAQIRGPPMPRGLARPQAGESRQRASAAASGIGSLFSRSTAAPPIRRWRQSVFEARRHRQHSSPGTLELTARDTPRRSRRC